ncbi:hypothetical protein [Bacillus badius]|uniref:hypothetical protein n=1 Tax=Bacillus badius TaxID=1455 RepID=UPI0007B366C4|nr:hypothetical protein [Bacillus badius]KZR59365.1 hypothetical protein A3781_13265 [Bacillus badius]
MNLFFVENTSDNVVNVEENGIGWLIQPSELNGNQLMKNGKNLKVKNGYPSVFQKIEEKDKFELYKDQNDYFYVKEKNSTTCYRFNSLEDAKRKMKG